MEEMPWTIGGNGLTVQKRFGGSNKRVGITALWVRCAPTGQHTPYTEECECNTTLVTDGAFLDRISWHAQCLINGVSMTKSEIIIRMLVERDSGLTKAVTERGWEAHAAVLRDLFRASLTCALGITLARLVASQL